MRFYTFLIGFFDSSSIRGQSSFAMALKKIQYMTSARRDEEPWILQQMRNRIDTLID